MSGTNFDPGWSACLKNSRFPGVLLNHSDISPFDSLRSLTAGRSRINELRAVRDETIAQ